MRSWIVAGILWVGLGVVGSPEVLCAKGKIQWRSAETQRISLRREQIPDLRSALSTLLRTHAKHPQRIVLHSEVQGPMQVGFVEGGSPEAVLSYLLSQHGLSVVNQAEQTLILPRKLVWKISPSSDRSLLLSRYKPFSTSFRRSVSCPSSMFRRHCAPTRFIAASRTNPCRRR